MNKYLICKHRYELYTYSIVLSIDLNVIPVGRAVTRTYLQGGQAEAREAKRKPGGGEAICKNISMYIV